MGLGEKRKKEWLRYIRLDFSSFETSYDNDYTVNHIKNGYFYDGIIGKGFTR